MEVELTERLMSDLWPRPGCCEEPITVTMSGSLVYYHVDQSIGTSGQGGCPVSLSNQSTVQVSGGPEEMKVV